MRWSFRRRADPKLGDATDLSAGEAALHRELLLRLATSPATAPR